MVNLFCSFSLLTHIIGNGLQYFKLFFGLRHANMLKGRPSKNKEGPAAKRLKKNGNCIVHCTSKEGTSLTYLSDVDDPDKQFKLTVGTKKNL